MERNDVHENGVVTTNDGQICKFYEDNRDDGWEHCTSCGGVFSMDGDHYSHWCPEVGDYVNERGQVPDRRPHDD